MKPAYLGTPRMSAALITMTSIMGVQHVFDDRLDELRGGPLRYVLDIDGRRYTAFQCDRTGSIIVSPLSMTDFLDEEFQDEPLPLISVSWAEELAELTHLRSPAYW